MGPYNNQPYDFNNQAVQAGLKNAYSDWGKVMQLNDAYKQQYGTNITDAALFRGYNEASGNYLWGPPASGEAVPANANVANPNAKLITDNGVYQNGTFTPNANVASQYPSRTDTVVNAPGLDQIDPWQTITRGGANGQPATYSGGVAQALANTTNLLNQATPAASGTATASAGNTGATATSSGTDNSTFSGSDALSKQMQDYLGKIQNPYDILQSREQALGVPQAQQQVSGLRQAITNTTNLLNQVAPSVEGRTANSLVTSAQANRQIQNESAPIQTNLTNLGQQAQDAQNSYQNLLSQATNEANMQSQGQQDVLKNMQTIYGNVFGSEQAKQQAAAQAQQFAEQQRQFNLQQLSAKYQFEQNLALDTKKFNLSEEQQAESVRQFNAQQALEQQKFGEQQALDQQAAAQQQWENQFNAAKQQAAERAAQQQLALDRQKASQGGGQSLDQIKYQQQLADQQKQQNVVNQISNNLNAVKGRDGYVSPASYQQAANDWVRAGYSLKDFNAYFGNFKNTNNHNYFK